MCLTFIGIYKYEFMLTLRDYNISLQSTQYTFFRLIHSRLFKSWKPNGKNKLNIFHGFHV